MPESIGNTSSVLPPGVVCDRCNNGRLAVLDKALCDFAPLRLRRTMLGVATKTGSVPSTRLSTGVVEHLGGSTVRFTGTGPGDNFLREVERGGDEVRLRLESSGGRRITAKYAMDLSAALLKTALELAWLDHGEAVMGSGFDHVRAAVLGSPRAGYIAAGRKLDPDHLSLVVTYNIVPTSEHSQMWVVGEYYGVVLATDSVATGPPVALKAFADVVTFAREDLHR